jgi:hypothetical protein
MKSRTTQRVARSRAAARKRIRWNVLQTRFRFNNGVTFDDFWGEQLLDADVDVDVEAEVDIAAFGERVPLRVTMLEVAVS